MNLQQIIRESVESVIMDSIISEEILREASHNMRNRYANNGGRTFKPNNNLQQKKKQNKIQANQAALDKKQQKAIKKQQMSANREQRAKDGRQERFNQWSDQWSNKYLPQESPENVQQGNYGYTNSGFDNAGNNAPQQTTSTNTPRAGQTSTQGQQQPAVDFSQYAKKLSDIVGNGIDPSPVQNNQQAVQHITALNYFVFNVITAINNGNIDSANGGAGGTYNGRNINPYQKDKKEVLFGAGGEASQGIVNFAGQVGDAPLNLARQYGMNITTPFDNIFSAGAAEHNKGINQTQNIANQKKYADAQRAAKTGQGGVNLVYLMQSVNQGCYPSLQSAYHDIDRSSGGVFGAVPQVSQCYEVLNNLATAVTNYVNTEKQQQAAEKQQTETTPKAVTQPENGKATEVNIDEEKYEKESWDLKKLNYDCDKIGLDKKINENVANCAQHVSYLVGGVTQALDNGIYFSKDASNGINSLTQLLSLDGVDNHNFPTYNAILEIYNGEYRTFENSQYKKEIKALGTIKKTIDVLYRVQQQLKADGVVENGTTKSGIQ